MLQQLTAHHHDALSDQLYASPVSAVFQCTSGLVWPRFPDRMQCCCRPIIAPLLVRHIQSLRSQVSKVGSLSLISMPALRFHVQPHAVRAASWHHTVHLYGFAVCIWPGIPGIGQPYSLVIRDEDTCSDMVALTSVHNGRSAHTYSGSGSTILYRWQSCAMAIWFKSLGMNCCLI